MMEWICSSSVLILGVILIRRIFQGKMKMLLQYALWGLVLLRLLIPFNIGHSALSISNFQPAPALTEVQAEPEQSQAALPRVTEEPRELPEQREETDSEPERTAWTEKEIPHMVLRTVWAVGALAVGGMFIGSNLLFRRRLVSSRHLFRRRRLPVYVAEDLESPCLFGVFHPAVYITEEVVRNPVALRHTLAHEFCHYRHKDHIWSALRGICLVIHWYNPLVWWAAILSQRDGEMACDESTVAALGERERKEYGRTLINISCQKSAHLLTAATTMTSDKKVLKERIMMITRKPKTIWTAMILVVLLSAVFVGCTFTGAKETEPAPDAQAPESTTQAVSQPSAQARNNEWFSAIQFPDGYSQKEITQESSKIFQGDTLAGGIFDITVSAENALKPENLAEGEGLTAVLRDEVMPQIAPGDYDYMVSNGIDGIHTDATFATRETEYHHYVFQHETGYYDLWVDSSLVDFQVASQMVDAVLHPGKEPEQMLAQKLEVAVPEGYRLFDSKIRSFEILKGLSDTACGVWQLDLRPEDLKDPENPAIQDAVTGMLTETYTQFTEMDIKKGEKAPIEVDLRNEYNTYHHYLIELDHQVYDLWFKLENTTEEVRNTIFDSIVK